jgi:hypothetical protein
MTKGQAKAAAVARYMKPARQPDASMVAASTGGSTSAAIPVPASTIANARPRDEVKLALTTRV